MLMRPQSCLMQHTGVFSATAAVRNDRGDLPTTLLVSYKAPRLGLPVPGLHNMTMSMRKGPCVGLYTLYSANWTIPGGISFASRIDIISGEMGSNDAVADDFNDAAELPGSCAPFQGSSRCEEVILGTTANPTTTVSSTDVATVSSSSLPEPIHNNAQGSAEGELRLGKAFSSFFQYLTNYIANFFFGQVSSPYFLVTILTYIL
jgi:hypothetical protein